MAPIEKCSVGIKVFKWSAESIFMVLIRFQVNLESAEVILKPFKNVFFNTNFTKFHNFVFFSYTDFGPDDFGRKNGLSRVCTLNGWAEVSVWSTLNGHFGPIYTAEMGKLLPHVLEATFYLSNHFLTIFRCLHEVLNFMGGFRPKKCSNQKIFGGIKVSNWYKELNSSVYKHFPAEFPWAEVGLRASKSQKMKISKKKSFEISALFGPIQFFSAQLFYD